MKLMIKKPYQSCSFISLCTTEKSHPRLVKITPTLTRIITVRLRGLGGRSVRLTEHTKAGVRHVEGLIAVVEAGHRHGGRGQAAPPILTAAAAGHCLSAGPLVMVTTADDGLLLVRGKHCGPTCGQNVC